MGRAFSNLERAFDTVDLGRYNAIRHCTEEPQQIETKP